MTHPLPVWAWLLGRFAGLWCALVTQVCVMAVVLLPVVWMMGRTLPATLICCVGLIVIECTVALSITMAARCMARAAVAAGMALVIVGAGYLTLDPRDLRDTPRAEAMPLYRAAQAALPQMQRINARAEAATGAAVPEGLLGYGVVYGLGYSAIALWVGGAAVRLRQGRRG